MAETILMINDFLDADTVGVFTTQYIESDEMLLVHNLSQVKVRLRQDADFLIAEMFSMERGWIEIRRETVSAPVSFFPFRLPKANEKTEAAKRDASIDEFRAYNALRYMKDLAILLGNEPESLDGALID